MTTAADILNAFNACTNPGEEIDLFENLAISREPPVDAFRDLLKDIKLEIVLVLAIRALDKVIDPNVRQRLKDNDGLLDLLSKQVQSGSSDTIRWAAARTIENLKFDFVLVSQYLSEKPEAIAQKILQQQLKKFAEPNLLDGNDYPSFINFWTYAAFDDLRLATVKYNFWDLSREWISKIGAGWKDSKNGQEIEQLNKFATCLSVMNALQIKGLNIINSALEKAEEMDENARQIDENQIFESLALLSLDMIPENYTDYNFSTKWKNIQANFFIHQDDKSLILWKKILLHCLQSDNVYTRWFAAFIAFNGRDNVGLGQTFYDKLRKEQSIITESIFAFYHFTFYQGFNVIECSYKRLEELAQSLEINFKHLKRKQVRRDSKTWHIQVSREMNNKKDRFLAKEKYSQDLYNDIVNKLEQIKNINLELYQKFLGNFKVNNLLAITVYNDNAIPLFNDYINNAKRQLVELDRISDKIATIQNLRENLDDNIKKIKNINPELYEQIFSNAYFDDIPQITIDDDRAIALFEEYDNLLKLKLSNFAKKIDSFYKLDPRVVILAYNQNNLEVTIKQRGAKRGEYWEKARLKREQIASISRVIALSESRYDNTPFIFSTISLSVVMLFLGVIPAIIITSILSVFIGKNSLVDIGLFIWFLCIISPMAMRIWGILEVVRDRASKAAYENSLSSLETELQALDARTTELYQQLEIVVKSTKEITEEEKNSVLKLLIL